MKKFVYAFAMVAIMLMATACPPEPEPVPEPDVNVSLGRTDAITPAVLVGESVPFTQAGDGTAHVRYAGDPVTLSFRLLGDFDGAKPFRRYVNYPIDYDFQLGNKPTVSGHSSEIDLMTVMPSTINLGNRSKGMTIAFNNLPAEALALEAISLTPESSFKVTLSFTDPFFTEGTITPAFSVDMSHFFHTPETENDILHFDAPLTKENGYKATKIFRIDGVVLDPDKFNAKEHKLYMDARIGLSGEVAFEGLKTTRSKLNAAPDAMKLNVEVVLLDLACASVTGRFDCTEKGVSHTFKLSDLETGAGVVLSDPSLNFDVETDLNYPFRGKVDAAARKSRRTYAEVKDILFDLPVADEGKTARKTCKPDGSDLSPLFAQTPEEFVMQIGAVSNQEVTGTIVLGQETTTKFGPVLESPVVLNGDFETVIERTLPIQNSQVGTALKEKKGVRLTGTIDNTLPLDGEMTVALVDSYGRSVIREVKQSVAADAKGSLDVTLSPVTTATEGIREALVTFKLKGKSGNRALKMSDALQTSLTVIIPGE